MGKLCLGFFLSVCLLCVLAVSWREQEERNNATRMDVNDFSYEDEMDAAIVGVLSACVGAHPKDEPYINKSIDMYEE
ncbi:hypothetical protein Taro_054521 [Colocasia esculenta]|uniref:Uncharacterized protein n=1 Tax=Colocasia esculenta TaxID=4460 RepID=A0A843XQX6_COLES|nr:hypothetical protein [Colocasia esculenta]